MDFLFAVILISSWVICGLFGRLYIPWLQAKMLGQFIREDGPQSHQKKAGTPTTGGVIILLGLVTGVATTFWLNPAYLTPDLWLVVAVTLVFALLGLADDVLKIAKKHNKGVHGYTKLAVQAVVGFGVGYYLYMHNPEGDITVFQWMRVFLGPGVIAFAALVIMAASNAVNITDGLDGLAGSTMAVSLITLALLFTGAWSQTEAAVYPDLAVVCFSLLGGIFGFLLYNQYPAKVFMGDTGSLALGGALGVLCLLGKVDFWLVLIGGIFVLEALSVILQVASFKTTGKRIFKMSPLHHHFELCGWNEERVVLSFVAIQVLLCGTAFFLYNRG
ncbi:MAG: phospho-N-acetylmuramoyl-pentapeptide-transferase [Cyanobacteria bacterium]|nr:phospho-N-acetylmuramoyl-pentapeptide-transferase [Cyanobacteriota bacterium]